MYFKLAFVIIVASLTLLPVYGFTLAKLWQWFMMPVLQLPQLHIWSAGGIAIMIRFLVANPDYKDTMVFIKQVGVWRSMRAAILEGLLIPVSSYAVGSILHYLMEYLPVVL